MRLADSLLETSNFANCRFSSHGPGNESFVIQQLGERIASVVTQNRPMMVT
jgi:hypothetical protein